MPTEELFGAYNFDTKSGGADHFEFTRTAEEGTRDTDHKEWIDLLSVSQSVSRSAADTAPTETVSMYFEKIEWTYSTSDVDDFAI